MPSFLTPGRLPMDPMVLIQPRQALGWCTDHFFFYSAPGLYRHESMSM